MSQRPRITLCLLWHMHQPCYYLVGDDVAAMPWVRLHALKNYYDIPSLLKDYPRVKCIFNVVPSLWEQLDKISKGELTDSFLLVAEKPAHELSHDERMFLLRNFFRVHPNLINEFSRFAELRDRAKGDERHLDVCAREWSERDFRDLQVLFHLAWSGWELRKDDDIQSLMQKGAYFSEHDKQQLFATQRAFLSRPMELYTELAASGQAELSSTPFYHPIVPLLLDTQNGQDGDPKCPLPERRFSWPTDAEEHIDRAMSFVQETMSQRLTGMWPSEGAVTQDQLALFRQHGVKWLATDEAILWKSLELNGHHGAERRDRAGHLYRPWKVATEHGDVCLFFRDRWVSDAIGFRYQSWNVSDAVGDFMAHLERSADQWHGEGTPVFSVILDGENAWEYYPNNGQDFLRGLYEALNDRDDIEMATFDEIVRRGDTVKPLQKIGTGSWIYGNLRTWVGHEEKNRAWDYLAEVREEIEALLPELDDETRVKVKDSLFRAEGSDWFWWYGDDHFTEFSREFDMLFRGHLRRSFEIAGKPAPAFLEIPVNKETEIKASGDNPVDWIEPQIDGRWSSYFEWSDAGELEASSGMGTMHRGSNLIDRALFGYSHEALYLCLVPTRNTGFSESTELEISIMSEKQKPHLKTIRLPVEKHPHEIPKENCKNEFDVSEICFDEIIEVILPFSWSGLELEQRFQFSFALVAGAKILERWPESHAFERTVPSREFASKRWIV